MISRLREGTRIDFVGRIKLWFVISGVLIALAAGSLYLRGINAGLEFRGGTAFEVEAGDRSATVAEVRGALAGIGVHQTTIQQVGNRGFLVQTADLETDEQRDAVRAIARTVGAEEREVNVTNVGPKWGAQITNKAIRALVIFLIVTVLYLSLRLEPKMAGAAMLAVIHDIAITAGIYSLSGFEVTPATVIALLTILGYSLYDTVVIFDRVKDRTSTLSAAGRVTYGQATNEALNQVLMRSISTTVTSLLPVGSLLFVGSVLLGAQTLRELALALFIGIAAGAYSSVFIATPFLAWWKEREARWSALRARIGARSAEVPAAVAAPAAAPAAAPVQMSAPTGAASASTPAGNGTNKRPPGKRKKKKHGRR